MKIKGRVWIKVNGVLVSEGSNVVSTVGKILVATILATSGTHPSHFGFGSGSSSPSEADTALGTEFAFGSYARHAFATSRVDNIVTYATTGGHWTNNSGGVLNLKEVGIFNASTSGTLLARFLSTPFTLQSGDVVNLSWSLTLG